jgi:hypothetical protein
MWHSAVLAALTPNDLAFQPGFERADTSIAAVISLHSSFPQYYDGDQVDRMPSSQIQRGRHRFSAHRDRDTYMPVQGARPMA